MHFITKLSKIISGNAIIKSANNNIVIFCFKVIAFSFTKLSRCFLYIFVFLNQISNLSDPFTKKKEANSKNGVVGSIGNIIPIAPSVKHINPTDTHINFLHLFIVTPFLNPYRDNHFNMYTL